MRFKIITTGFNARPYLPACLDSIRSQTVQDFDVCVVDDASPDPETGAFVRAYCQMAGDNWHAVVNEEHRGTLYNQVHAIRALDPDPEDVIVFVDADDRLAHPGVLARLVDAYADGTMLTYGSYRSEPFSPTCSPAQPYPPEVVAAGSFRAYAYKGGLLFNHLRTFRHELFAQLEDSDFKGPDGRWLQTAPDTALMMPCLELARGNFKFLPDTLYIYRSDNPDSFWRVCPRQVDADNAHVLRTLKPKVRR